MQSLLVKFALPAIAVGMLIFGYMHSLRSQPTSEKLAPPAPPVRSAYKDTVSAAGLVEARSENIALGVAVPGVVLEVYVTPAEVGRSVKKGTALFKVDDRQLQAQLRVQQANLAAMQAQLAKLEAMPRVEERPPSQAKAKAAEANFKLAKDQADRARKLLERQAISDEDNTQRQMTLEVARFQMEQAKADYALLDAGAWKADLDVSRAAVAMAKAQVEQTQTEIERAIVRAPIDGHVLQVNVRPGEYVGTQPGQSLMMLGDLTTYHVRVDIDEHDIPRFTPGASAKARLRGDAQHEFDLTFVRVERYVTPKKSLTGDNTERVDTRVLQAIFAVNARDAPIYVGQQLDVFINAHRHSH
jgi:multidrug resistance efflux pump